jgi:hypothetical protein
VTVVGERYRIMQNHEAFAFVFGRCTQMQCASPPGTTVPQR